MSDKDNSYHALFKCEGVPNMLKDYNFNLILNSVKDSIMLANTNQRSKCFITNIFAEQYDNNLVEEVRLYLINKGYTVTYPSHAYNNNITAWLVEWS